MGTKANLILAACAGACTAIIAQPLDTASSHMQTVAFGRSKGLWAMLTEGSWSEAFDGFGISLLLASNPAIQVNGQTWFGFGMEILNVNFENGDDAAKVVDDLNGPTAGSGYAAACLLCLRTIA